MDQSQDSTGKAPREHHIPLRPADLIQSLADDAAVTIFQRHQFQEFCQLAAAIIHHDCHAHLQRLLACYAPFHPDDDSPSLHHPSPADRSTASRQLFDEFDSLLKRANYNRLSPDEIERATRLPGATGLKLQLDLTIFERLEVYVRGRCQLARELRPWPGWTSASTVEIPAYRRLAIIFRLKERSPRTDPLNTRVVVLKLFKDIPCDDLEALLPGAWVQIGLLDQAKIFVPTLSGLALTLLKLLKGAAAVTFASLYGLAAFLALVGGALGYGAKSFFGYLNLREKHQLSLTRQLYYQNLDNNAGVIYHLLAEAEEQELRELVLGWWLLWRGGLQGATSAQIDAAAEQWLRGKGCVAVDFEIADALHKLQKLGLAFSSPTGRWRAVAIEEALERLDRYWDEQFNYRRDLSAPQQKQPRVYRRAA